MNITWFFLRICMPGSLPPTTGLTCILVVCVHGDGFPYVTGCTRNCFTTSCENVWGREADENTGSTCCQTHVERWRALLRCWWPRPPHGGSVAVAVGHYHSTAAELRGRGKNRKNNPVWSTSKKTITYFINEFLKFIEALVSIIFYVCQGGFATTALYLIMNKTILVT